MQSYTETFFSSIAFDLPPRSSRCTFSQATRSPRSPVNSPRSSPRCLLDIERPRDLRGTVEDHDFVIRDGILDLRGKNERFITAIYLLGIMLGITTYRKIDGATIARNPKFLLVGGTGLEPVTLAL